MSGNVKVSIVVPIYKSEKYINRTIDSLINQTIDNYEIVLVNDGSPDNCLSIMKEYQEKNQDKNIQIIDKPNGGVWRARIDGIKAAKGDYICFMDGDDYLDSNFLEKMYDKITKTNADISVCGFKRIDEETKKVLSQEMKHDKDRVIDLSKNADELISVNTAVWNKIYKASILKNIREFENPPRILEDMMFMLLTYLKANKITFVDDYLYNYMVIGGSAMNTIKDSDIQLIKDSLLEVKDEYNKCNASQIKKEVLASMAFLHLGISFLLRVYTIDKKKYKVQYKNIMNFLDENFPGWRKIKYLKLTYNLTHKSGNLKVAIVKKVHDFHMFKLFLDVYNFVTSTLKIDIKW